MLETDPIEQSRKNWIAHASGRVDQVTAATALTRARQIVVSRSGNVVATSSLTFAQLEVLSTLCQPDAPSSLAELSRELTLHPTTVARTATRLARNGYVERDHDKFDKRVVIITVTPSGRTAAATALTALKTIEFGLAGWSSDDAARFTKLIEPIIGATVV